ncbi:hypothetical protein GCM10027051_21560 [Niabella terrae]
MKILHCLLLLLFTHSSFGQSAAQLKNLEAFARLYGYVRYFHPSDEAASINWDQLAVYGAGAVLDAPDETALTTTLMRLFKPVAPLIEIGTAPRLELSKITPTDTSGYQEIFWLHSGVGISAKSTYSSLRLNRPRPEPESRAHRYAPFTRSLKADSLRGKEIKLTGRMKADVSTGSGGHFWLRVDLPGQAHGFFYNMSDRLVTSTEWQTYSFTGKVDEQAEAVFFGGGLIGSGTIWADDIALYSRSSSQDPWVPIPLENSDFESVDAEGHPGQWYAGPLKGYEFQIMEEAANHVLRLSNTLPEAAAKNIVRSFEYQSAPRPSDLIQERISEKIKVCLPLVLYGNRDHTYPVGDTAILSVLKSAMAAYFDQHRTADSAALRLGDVVIAWNIFKHFFPYWQDASKNPDEILKEALSKALTDKTPMDFRKTLLEMTAPLNDGHIFVNLAGDVSHSYALPLQTAFVEGKIVVDAVLDSNVQLIKPGDIIESFDGTAALDLFKRITRDISGSPQWKSYRAMQDLVTGAPGSTTELMLLRQGHRFKVRLDRSLNLQQYYKAINQLRRTSGQVSKGIYYLDLNSLSGDTIQKWKKQLSRAKGIICDLRGYPNGNHILINYLLKSTEDTKWMFVPKTAWPNQQHIEYREGGWNMHPLRPHFKGKIVFITDGRAISYAESFMGFIKDFQLATIIGQPTAGTNGNINPFNLPGGYRISWTGMLVKNHDGSRHHLIGILPDLPLERTIDGVREGRDEFYEKALELVYKATR